MPHILYILCLLSLTLTRASVCKQGFTITDGIKSEIIGQHTFTFRDSTNQSFKKIKQSKKFKQSTNPIPSLGISKDNYWVKLKLCNQSSGQHYLLSIEFPSTDEVLFFYPEKDGYKQTLISESLPFHTRKYKTPHYVFDINIPESSSQTYYFRIKSPNQVSLPLSIKTPQGAWEDAINENIILGIYVGISVFTILYNFFVFLSIRDKSYLYYILYVTFNALIHVGNLRGLSFHYLWPTQTDFEAKSLVIFSSLAAIFTILFIKQILSIKSQSIKLVYIFNGLIALFILSVIMILLNIDLQAHQLMKTTTTILAITVFVTTYYMAFKGYRTAIFTSIGWTIWIIGATVFILREYSILPHTLLTYYSMIIVTSLEFIFFSFALADRIRALRKEKQKALETQLNTAHNLSQAQSKLLESSRLADMGRGVAQLAHELNNPIYLVRSAAQHITTETDHLLKTIETISFESLKDTLSSYKKDLTPLSAGLLTNINRLARLVNNLRQTSADRAHMENRYLKLKDYIQTTIISHEISLKKKNISVKLTGDNPIIYTDPGLIYQIIQNLITNTEKYAYDKEGGTIDINIRVEKNIITIVYQDYGKGISEKDLPHIFNAFYTTGKSSGGIGLGLNIIKKIINEQLFGTIQCESKEGEGTRFIIILDKKNVS